MSESQIQQITAYLDRAMPGCVVRTPGGHSTGETVISVHDRECEYTLRIDPEFGEAYTEQDIPRLLSDWNLAAEMLRSEGMPLMLTAAGIRLASSN